MLANFKYIISIFLFFFKQRNIRPYRNNLSLLITNLHLIFSNNAEKYYLKKHTLNGELLENIIKLPVNNEPPTEVEVYNVWVLWWQGEENMPPIVKCTYNSIKRMTNKNVVLITQKNWTNYITPDPWIIEKVNTKKMKLPALSDYIRASLLYEYGGLWIDSTVLCTDRIPEYVYKSTLFSIHANKITNKYIAFGRWNVQILGTNKKHLYIFKCIKHIFSEYWKKYDDIMDYLLVDYSINYIYNSDTETKNLINSIPFTNPKMHELRALFNENFDESKYNALIQNTYFFKLSYKTPINRKNDQYTFYNYILEKWK